MQERIIHGDSVIDGDLVIEDFNYIVKGDLTVEGTVIIKNGDLIVEGDLLVYSDADISVACGSIYAKSVNSNGDICISNGNISTLRDLDCMNIFCPKGDISVGRNSYVLDVRCRNYLVDGKNYSENIIANDSVYIMDYSYNHCITAPEVFLGGGGEFNCNPIITNHFEFDGHVYNCARRYFLSEVS